MVYQHFTLVANMTVLENLVLSRARRAGGDRLGGRDAAVAPSWRGMPFTVPLDQPVRILAAGEKQKAEIIKQLYLDAPLADPRRADVGADARGGRRECSACCARWSPAGRLTVLIITHKFREVMAFADEVTVLRRGERSAAGGSPDCRSTIWPA